MNAWNDVFYCLYSSFTSNVNSITSRLPSPVDQSMLTLEIAFKFICIDFPTRVVDMKSRLRFFVWFLVMFLDYGFNSPSSVAQFALSKQNYSWGCPWMRSWRLLNSNPRESWRSKDSFGTFWDSSQLLKLRESKSFFEIQFFFFIIPPKRISNNLEKQKSFRITCSRLL